MKDKKSTHWNETKAGAIIGLITGSIWAVMSLWQVITFISRNDARMTCVATVLAMVAGYSIWRAATNLHNAKLKQRQQLHEELMNFQFKK